MSMPRPWPTEAEALAIPVGELALHVLWRLVSTPQGSSPLTSPVNFIARTPPTPIRVRELAARGVRITPVSETCPKCKGWGQEPYQPPANLRPASGSETRNCTRCRGIGQVTDLRDDEVPVTASEVKPHRRGGPLG